MSKDHHTRSPGHREGQRFAWCTDSTSTEFDACWHIGVLQGGDHVETSETSEYCSLHWRYSRSFAICIGVDAQRNSDRLSRHKSGCESCRPGESFTRNRCFADTFFFFQA